MLRSIILVVLAASVAGCGWFGQREAAWTGYSKTCVDGVMYIQFTSGASVAYASDGKIQLCK